MNWMKVKIILIIMFLIINAILVGVLYADSVRNRPDTAQMQENIASILESRSITVDKNIISTQTYQAEIADAYPISSKQSEFYKNLSENAEITEDGTYLLKNSEIMVYDNFVHFQNSDTSISNAEDYFASVGLDFSSAYPVSVTEKDGTVIYLYNERYGKYDIFGAKAEVTVSDGAVVSADVVWYEITGKHTQLSKTISFAEALLDFASDKSRGNKPCTVSDITFGYSTDTGSQDASMSQMIPCIRITTDIGSEFYYDARSPEQ